MSDLISKKKICDYIKGKINPYGKPFEGTAYELGLKIIRYIDDMDSAYDVDKVVKELYEERTEILLSNDYECEIINYCLDNFDNAIEIVKQGSVSDDTNNMCDWIKYDYKTICPKNHDANNPYWRIPDNMDKLKYCPYCGRR